MEHNTFPTLGLFQTEFLIAVPAVPLFLSCMLIAYQIAFISPISIYTLTMTNLLLKITTTFFNKMPYFCSGHPKIVEQHIRPKEIKLFSTVVQTILLLFSYEIVPSIKDLGVKISNDLKCKTKLSHSCSRVENLL